jgi:hypothetical protein
MRSLLATLMLLFVNHRLANLNPSMDVIPFAFRKPDMFAKGKAGEYLYHFHPVYGVN